MCYLKCDSLIESILLKSLAMLITQWSRFRLRKLKSCSAIQKNSQPFMEPEGSLMCSHESATGPFSDPLESSPQPHTHFF